jgi:hypothetical protein
LLPHTSISGDDEVGRCSRFRQELRERGERYLLAVPSSTTVRDRTATPPHTGPGRRQRVPFTPVDQWCSTQPEEAWQTLEVRAGQKGPITVQAVSTLVQARTEGRVSDRPEVPVVFREAQANGTWKHDYPLSNAAFEVPVQDYARVFNAQHRVDECLQRAKGEAGLGACEVRTWRRWYHHQVMALTATWFLTLEAWRGKKMDTGIDAVSTPDVDGWGVGAPVGNEQLRVHASHGEPARIEEARSYRWNALKRLPPLRVDQREQGER